MTPEDVTAQLNASVQEFSPILDLPTDNDLKNIKDTFSTILINIPYDAVNKTHNLWGVIAILEAYI